MSRRPWDPEPKYVTRSLTPLRRGSAGSRREAVRQMLIRLMGFNADDLAQNPQWFRTGVTPSHFGRDRLSPQDASELARIAQDALYEMAYDAAAEELRSHVPDYLHTDAREALAILEAGPPSIKLDRHIVFRRPLYKFQTPDSDRNFARKFIIAKSINDHARPWYRFLVGRAVHDQRGTWMGWDEDAGHTFQRRARTLKEAREGSYGSTQL